MFWPYRPSSDITITKYFEKFMYNHKIFTRKYKVSKNVIMFLM